MQKNKFNFVILHTHPCFSGHFPGNPIVPGAVILEQVILKWAIFSKKKILRFDYSKFTHRLLADTNCSINFTQFKSNIKKIDFIVKTDDQLIICKGRLVHD